MYLIVGVDPGTKTGIAALNLDGGIVGLHSSKDLGFDRTLDYLMSLGVASVLASDVSPTPQFILKLASSLGCRVFIPKKSLQVGEKIKLTWDHTTGDSHQRDALAAALNAYNAFRNKFGKIDSLDLDDKIKTEIKHRVLQGVSVDDAIREYKTKQIPAKPKEEPPKIKTKKPPEEERVNKLLQQNQDLKKQVKSRDEEIKKLKNDVIKLEDKISRMKTAHAIELKKDVEIKKRDGIIKNIEYRVSSLEKKIRDTEEEKIRNAEELRKLWALLSTKKITPVGVFPQHFNGMTVINRRLKKQDQEKIRDIKIAFTDDPENQKILAEKDITAGDMGCLHSIANYFYTTPEELNKTKKKPSLEEIIEEYRAKRSLTT